MEKKKLLLVAVSVGVVLLIILIIPLLIISPKKDFGASWEQSAVIEPPNMTQGWESVKEPEPVVEAAVVPPPKAVEQSNVTTITVPAPRSVAVPDAVLSPARQAPKARPVAEAPKEVKPQATVAAKPAVEKPVAEAKPPVAKASDKSVSDKPKTAKTYDSSKYWIQTGAFSTITHAEGAKDYLEARGIKSIIEDPVINGKTWYRVRVGPYTTRDEANYWLALVKAIDGFAASQVWEAR